MLSKKVILAVSIFVLFGACDNSDSAMEQKQQENTEEADDSLLQIYTNTSYSISLSYPQSWKVKTFKDLQAGGFALNIYRPGAIAPQDLPLAVHAEMAKAYVAIWPQGLATELPAGTITPLKDVMHSPALNFAVNRMESKLLLLKNGSIWGYFLVPKNPPESWSDDGFIYAQVGVNEASSVCYDEETGDEIPMEKCDNLEGDRIIRSGNIDEETAEIIRNILESISLEPVDGEVAAAAEKMIAQH